MAVAANHMVGDLRTLRSFLEHWAAAARGLAVPDGQPVQVDEKVLQGSGAAPGPKVKVYPDRVQQRVPQQHCHVLMSLLMQARECQKQASREAWTC